MAIPWIGILVLYSTYETSFDLDCEGSVPCRRAKIEEESYSPFRKGRSLSIYPSPRNSHHLSVCQFVASLDWYLCRDLAEQNRAENNIINSHTQDATALQLNVLLYSRLWVQLTNMYRFVCPELPLSSSLFFSFFECS